MRILIVDDDTLVLMTLERMLKEHQVKLANGADEALAILESGAAFDAVLCDLHMPGMNGDRLYGILCAQYPELAKRTVFVGCACTDEEQLFLDARTSLTKPFKLDELERVLAPLSLSLSA
jgi:CheY-like chemotaxis protein